MESKVAAAILSLCCLLVTHSTADICREKICEYSFDIQWSEALTYRSPAGFVFGVKAENGKFKVEGNSYNTPMSPGCSPAEGMEADLIGTYVNVSDVISLDGVKRDVITVNGHFPGPTIEVMDGTEIVVHVTNHLHTEGLTIHWHGIHQRGTQWMDGSAYVSQCPILPHQTFTYSFKADPPGTRWYHSHMKSQRNDGLYGMLIVHPKEPIIPEHSLMVSDWWHMTSRAFDIQNPQRLSRYGSGELFASHSSSPIGPDGNPTSHATYMSGLINGRGRYMQDTVSPLSVFAVDQGIRYRFRIVNTGSEFGFMISIDNHQLIVVNSDGSDLEATPVEYVFLLPGETYDVEVEMDQTPALYWIRARTLTEKIGSKKAVEEVHAVLAYSGVNADTDPTSQEHVCSDTQSCKVFNCPFGGYGASHGKTCVDLVTAKGARQDYSNYGLQEDNYEEFFFNLGNLNGPSINGIRFTPAKTHLYEASKKLDLTPCDHSTTLGHHEISCTHIVDVPLRKTIQLVVTNYLGKYTGMDHVQMNGGHGMDMDEEPDMSMHAGRNMSMDGVPEETTPAPHHMMNKNSDDNTTSAGNMNGDDQYGMGDGSHGNHHGMAGSKCHEMTHAMVHGIHLHGSDFAVLHSGYAPYNHTTGATIGRNTDILCSDELCSAPKWKHGKFMKSASHESPPIKNTLVVPPMGYVVIRFRSDNPGYWSLHCHTESHMMGGMRLVLDMGHKEVTAIPTHFPSCLSFDDKHIQLADKLDTADPEVYGLTVWQLALIGGAIFVGGALCTAVIISIVQCARGK